MLPRSLVWIAVALLGTVSPLAALSEAQRREHVAWMLEKLPDVPEWTDWQRRTGELPPDFDALPSHPFLPPPLQFADGRPVRSAADWPARRAEIRRLMERYQTGTFPPPPKIERVDVLDETRGDGVRTRNVRLHFGPEGKASLRVQVTLPEGPGRKPVLICPSLLGWAPQLVRRGYISAGYAGNDFMDDTAGLPDLYPDFDFAKLPRRAWVVPLVIDYLETLPEVDSRRIALFGYSRDGKMAAFAAVLDERIAALVAGSTGVGGFLPWRLSGERGMGESIESTTRMFPDWLHPRLRFFAGREDRLPIDANLLLAAIAPRAVLIQHGYNDEVTNVWANEQAYRSALDVYRLLGAPEKLGLLRVPGFHGGNDQEACIDWLDIQFGRSTRTWDNDLLFPWSFNTWRRTAGAAIDPAQAPRPAAPLTDVASRSDAERHAVAVRESIAWMLGPTPPRYVPPEGSDPLARFLARRGPPPGPTVVAEGKVGNPGQLAPDVPAWVISRGGSEFGWLEPEKNATASRRLRFSGVTADLYYPARLPTVIWLHGHSYPLGYMWVYRRDLHPILALVRAGYAVLAFDQIGYGARQAELAPFYERFPQWSQLGKMVEDVRLAVDALEKEALVDSQRVYAFGYSLGGMVGLHAVALEPRIQGVVALSGFTPMRTNTAERSTGGLARFSHERPLLPRLAHWIGHERDVPYDYDDLLAAIAPRPVLVVQPTMDRDASVEDVRAATERARRIYDVYQARDRLGLHTPHDYRLTAATQETAIQWLNQQTGTR